MATSNKISNLLLLAIPSILIFFLTEPIAAVEQLLSENHPQAEIAEAAEEAGGLVSAAAEGILALFAFSAVLLFNNLRRKPDKKAAKRFDKLGYECAAPAEKTERVRKEKITENSRAKKISADVSEEALRLAAERTRLTELVHNLSKNGDVARATKALERLEETCGTPTLADYSTVITSCAKANDPDQAHQWIQRLRVKGLTPSAVCFNAVINAYAKMGDTDKTVAAAEEMGKSGLAFDTVTYNTLIDACTRKGDAAEAQVWMKKMLAAGVKASVVSFGSVMRACARAGLGSDLEYWIKQADELGIELNMICFSAVINAFAKNGDIDSAEHWLTRMTECNVHPSVHCFTGMVDAALKVGNIERATKIVQRMREYKVEPDAGIYSWLVIATCQNKMREQAQRWIDEATLAGIQLNRQAKTALCVAKLVLPTDADFARAAARAGKASPNKAATAKAVPFDAPIDQEAMQACLGQRFEGTVKEYISAKFGYICCEETFAIFKRDIFLSSQDNPEQFAKGQRVSFVLQVDRRRGLPRAESLRAAQK